MNSVSAACLALVLAMAPGLARPDKPGFDSVDVNRDGILSLAEFATVFPVNGAQLFARIDRDRDGQVTVDEYARLTPTIEIAGR